MSHSESELAVRFLPFLRLHLFARRESTNLECSCSCQLHSQYNWMVHGCELKSRDYLFHYLFHQELDHWRSEKQNSLLKG